MRIGLLGDTHSNFPFIGQALNIFSEENIRHIIQVGDLGIWPGKKYESGWDAVNLQLEIHDQWMYVTPGNHEDYDQIEKLEVVNNEGWLRFRDRIHLASRGLRTTVEDVSFVFLGGAPSVDRMWRLQTKNQKLWWPQEAITEEDIQKTIAGGHAQVMIAHDAPLGVQAVNNHIYGNPNGFHRADLGYAYQGRALLEQAFVQVQPEFFIHGHYHFPYSEVVGAWGTNMMGMSWDGDLNGSLGELEVRDGRVIDASHWKLYPAAIGYGRKK